MPRASDDLYETSSSGSDCPFGPPPFTQAESFRALLLLRQRWPPAPVTLEDIRHDYQAPELKPRTLKAHVAAGISERYDSLWFGGSAAGGAASQSTTSSEAPSMLSRLGSAFSRMFSRSERMAV